MLFINRDVLLHFYLVDCFENGETMAKAGYTNLLQFLMSDGYECFAVDFFLCFM